jgi:biofilm PGA synthesis lipoprotein PgaB
VDRLGLVIGRLMELRARCSGPRIAQAALAGLMALVALAVLALPAFTYRYVRDEVRVAHRYPAPVLSPLSPLEREHYAVGSAQRSFVVVGYHDLATAQESAAPLTVSVLAFAAQLRMLAASGYRAVSAREVAEALAGRRSLPRRSVLITFEGGQARVWTHADTVLARYGYSAVVFVDPADIGRRRFLNWEELTAMVRTGRWSVGVRTPRAARALLIDARGTRSSGLLAHRWRPDKGRAETTAEFRRRVGGVLTGARSALVEHGLPSPALYSYPFQPGYPFARAGAGFRELTSIVDRYFPAGVLSTEPDRAVDAWWTARRLLPRSVVYGATTDRLLSARLTEALQFSDQAGRPDAK